MSNLPSDWGSYSRTCSKCGARYHESGTEQCDCEPCEAPKCWELVPPDDYEEQDSLCAGHFEQKLEDEDVEPECDFCNDHGFINICEEIGPRVDCPRCISA